MLDHHRGGQAADHQGAIGAHRQRDHVVTVGAIDLDRVDRVVAGCATGGAGQVDVDLAHVSATQVVDHDVVSSTQRVEVDMLDAVKIHGDAGHVACKQYPLAVGRDVDVLGHVGTVEEHGVQAC